MCVSTLSTEAESNENDTPSVTHVAAGAIFSRDGKVLLTQRKKGTHLAGLWEFPGGKLEPDETVEQALSRELFEEIGISPLSFRPLIKVLYHYPEKSILLDVWRIDHFEGDLISKEGQAVKWTDLNDLGSMQMPAADIPVIKALQLPARYMITPDPARMSEERFLEGIKMALKQGVRLVQLRSGLLSENDYLKMAEKVYGLCRRYDAKFFVNGDASLMEMTAADGLHMPARLWRNCNCRPVDEFCWFGVSCHSREELETAVNIGADYALLSPVCNTMSHPGTLAIGWDNFRQWSSNVNIPVYALGGMTSQDIGKSHQYGGQGIAAITAFWPQKGRDSVA